MVGAAARAAPAPEQVEQPAPLAALATPAARGAVRAAIALLNPPAAKAVRLEILRLNLPAPRVRTASIPQGRALGRETLVRGLRTELIAPKARSKLEEHFSGGPTASWHAKPQGVLFRGARVRTRSISDRNNARGPVHASPSRLGLM